MTSSESSDASGPAQRADEHELHGDAEHEHRRRDDQDREERVDVQVREERVAQVRGEDHERALSHVDHPHDPEDERQPARHQRVDAADQDAEDDRLDDLMHVDPFARCLLAPGGLRDERLVQRDVLRVDGVELAADPLDEQVAALRLADRVPAQVALDRRPGALVQRRDDLLVVDRVDLRSRRPRRPGRRRRPRPSRGRSVRRAAVRLEVGLDERGVPGRLRLREPVARG